MTAAVVVVTVCKKFIKPPTAAEFEDYKSHPLLWTIFVCGLLVLALRLFPMFKKLFLKARGSYKENLKRLIGLEQRIVAGPHIYGLYSYGLYSDG